MANRWRLALIVLTIVGLTGFILADSGKKVIPLIELVLGAGVGISFFFVINFFISSNGFNPEIFYAAHSEISLGAGSICVIVFSFIAAALALLNLVADSKK